MKMLFTALCVLPFNAFADHHNEMEGKSFDEKKAMMSSHLDQRIAHLNEMKNCVSGAKDQAALKSCHQQMKEHRREMKEQWKKKK